MDLRWSIVGSDANTYDESSSPCGLIPGELTDIGEMFPGASSTGNVCVQAPGAVLDGGAWMVEESMSIDDSGRTFIAVG